jgi:transcriptional regulator with XRE-family HTH domain
MTIKKTTQSTELACLVGPMVREFRIRAGLTQKELAARCQERGLELTRGTLANIESKVRFTTACELFILARVLKTPMENFFPAGFGDRRSR